MASMQSIEEEFLTCAICTEIYTDPCTLGCGHSFCRECVTQSIKTSPEAIQSKTIQCAFCRQVTKAPDQMKPAEEWAGQIRPSLILVGLMDRHQSGQMHEEGQDLCFLCKEIGETTLATSWCSDCEVTLCCRCAKMHPKAPASKYHDVYSLSEKDKIKTRRKVKCVEHEAEQIKFLCRNCNKTACQTCCIIKHRACKHVVTIESMIPEIKSILEEKRQHLKIKMKDNMASARNEESKIEQLENGKNKTASEIKSTIESAVTLLRKKEKELLGRLDDISDEQILKHQANIKIRQITAQMYQQNCEFIDQTLQSESEMDMYDMYQVCLSGAVDSVVGPDSDTSNTSVAGEVIFTPNMEPLGKAITEMGKVDVKVWTRETPKSRIAKTPSTLMLSTPVLHETVDVKQKGGIGNPTDVTVMNVDGIKTLIVAEYSLNCLKSVYVKNGRKEICKLKLSGSPTGIAVTGKLVVAPVSNTHIVVAEVRPQLVLKSNMKTERQYWGIAPLPDSVLAAGSPSVVDILDLSGNILKSITQINTGLKLIRNPYYLSTTLDGNILASDYFSKAVYCLTPKGHLVFSYQPTDDRELRDAGGIAVTKTGDVILADTMSHSIILLTSDGTFVRVLLTSNDGINNPSGIYVDDTNKLYICDRDGGDQGIKVFKL